MIDKEFNLLHESWISVMEPDGKMKEVSLLELFRRGQEFRSLAGELPTQDVAVLRLLLAILHAVFGRYGPEGDSAPISSPDGALTRWKALWDGGAFPMKIIEDYLLHYEDRFWLFHPEYPFYQVAVIRDKTDKFGPFEASKLNGELAESDHKNRLFPQRAGNSRNVLQYDEAARWLVYVNAFAETFGKLEAKGKQSKNSPSLGVGWLGKLGLIIAVGDNLFETLLLNLVLLKDGGNKLWGQEEPVWEAKTVPAEERHEITMPNNPSALLTLQSRRLLLNQETGCVAGYTLLSGDFFPKTNAFTEQMTVWRNAAKKETEPPEYHPKRHDSARQLWRDFPALVIQRQGIRRPGVIGWLARLKSENLIPRSHFRFQTAAVSYGTMEAVIDDVFSDSLSFNAALLTDLGEDWVSRIISEISSTEQMVDQVGYLAQNLAKAAGDTDGSGQKKAAREQAYFRLNEPFRRWLERIDPERDAMDEVCEKWWEEARRIVQDLGKELVNQSGPQAFIGRDGYNASKAYNSFKYRTSTRETLEERRQ